MGEKYQPEVPLTNSDGEPYRLPRCAAMVALLISYLRSEPYYRDEEVRSQIIASQLLSDVLITIEVARRAGRPDVVETIEPLLPFSAPVTAWLSAQLERSLDTPDCLSFRFFEHPFLTATVRAWATETVDLRSELGLPFAGTAERLFDFSVALSEQRPPGPPAGADT